MTRTRLETNFIRLLEQCKSMANTGRHTEWRFEKYIASLEEQLADLRKGPVQLEKDVLDEYNRSLQFLKGLIITEKLPCATEKVVATQFLSPCPSPYGDPMTKGIKHKVAALYSNEVRDELLSNQTPKLNLDEPLNKVAEPDNMLSSLRQRKSELLNTGKSSIKEQDFDVVMKNEQHSQEKFSEHMLLLAKDMKEHASLAGSIIRNDIKTLEKSNTIAEENMNNLQIHSQKLRERSGWCARCWIWLVLAVAIFLFIGMAMLMRVVPKKKPI